VPREAVPTLDLVVATVDRTEPLEALLGALDEQTHRAFRVLIVDQNDDDRVELALRGHRGLDALHLRSPRGLSRARNIALRHLAAPLVAFPDDDCLYPPDLLERVVRRFGSNDGLDGLSGRAADVDGHAVGRWPSSPTQITAHTVWHTANSHTMFLRRAIVERVGAFDESLGLGAGTPWSSGEETDFLVRALRLGARIEYDPTLVITHPVKPVTADELVALGRREGASVGYILAGNTFPARTIGRMLARPALGALVSLALLDTTRARFHAATLGGRLRGLRAGRRRRLSVPRAR
jgi:GT2 family glycosyltransferase